MQHVNEDVAEQFRDAYPNAKLLSIAPVALPLYLVTADVLVGAKRNIPSITEFILRGERAGLTSEMDVAGFLGLNQRLVTRTTIELSDNGFVGRNASGQIHSTDRGTALLREMSQW